MLLVVIWQEANYAVIYPSWSAVQVVMAMFQSVRMLGNISLALPSQAFIDAAPMNNSETPAL
jgi:hypothetical protein